MYALADTTESALQSVHLQKEFCLELMLSQTAGTQTCPRQDSCTILTQTALHAVLLHSCSPRAQNTQSQVFLSSKDGTTACYTHMTLCSDTLMYFDRRFSGTLVCLSFIKFVETPQLMPSCNGHISTELLIFISTEFD